MVLLLGAAHFAAAQDMGEEHDNPPSIFGKGFKYTEIKDTQVSKAENITPAECQAKCQADETCVAWEVCAPLGDGCDGCYRVSNRPALIDREGWTAGFIAERAAGKPIGLPPLEIPETNAGCKDFLLKANGADPNNQFSMEIYSVCGHRLREDPTIPKDIDIYGQHYPTSLVHGFKDPTVRIPADVETQLRGKAVNAQVYDEPSGPGSVTEALHRETKTAVLPPTVNHAFVVPFYDTNIGHWIKEYGSMNILQSYEMQSLLRPGDTVIDVGANLGSFTIPFAERVGRQGKVLAFEPFRWLFQLTTANVAVNGLSNVWTFNVGLGESSQSFEARPPQLRFFSSPGGVRLREQDKDMKVEQSVQLYDYEVAPETVSMAKFDDLLAGKSFRLPPIDDIRLVKIDVEGMEHAVIFGASEAIRTYKPIIWTENVPYFESEGRDTSFLYLMDQLDYACAKAQNAPNDLICTNKNGEGHQVGMHKADLLEDDYPRLEV